MTDATADAPALRLELERRARRLDASRLRALLALLEALEGGIAPPCDSAPRW